MEASITEVLTLSQFNSRGREKKSVCAQTLCRHDSEDGSCDLRTVEKELVCKSMASLFIASLYDRFFCLGIIHLDVGPEQEAEMPSEMPKDCACGCF